MKQQADTDAPHLHVPPFTDELEELPALVFFRIDRISSRGTYPTLCHPWSEFIYSFCGVTEVRVGKNNVLAPPHLGLWIAPGTEHTCVNDQATTYCALYIRRSLCFAMPKETCALLVSPLVRAILEHLKDYPQVEQRQSKHERLLRVLVDQLSTCQATGSFMPHTDDPELGAILQALRADPADNRSLRELAAAFHIGERTLIRRSQQELGMSLTEWRQRQRLVTSLPLLRDGRSVEAVALDLGYATSSAFIAMFRRLTGSSPRRFMRDGLSDTVS